MPTHGPSFCDPGGAGTHLKGFALLRSFWKGSGPKRRRGAWISVLPTRHKRSSKRLGGWHRYAELVIALWNGHNKARAAVNDQHRYSAIEQSTLKTHAGKLLTGLSIGCLKSNTGKKSQAPGANVQIRAVPEVASSMPFRCRGSSSEEVAVRGAICSALYHLALRTERGMCARRAISKGIRRQHLKVRGWKGTGCDGEACTFLWKSCKVSPRRKSTSALAAAEAVLPRELPSCRD